MNAIAVITTVAIRIAGNYTSQVVGAASKREYKTNVDFHSCDSEMLTICLETVVETVVKKTLIYIVHHRETIKALYF